MKSRVSSANRATEALLLERILSTLTIKERSFRKQFMIFRSWVGGPFLRPWIWHDCCFSPLLMFWHSWSINFTSWSVVKCCARKANCSDYWKGLFIRRLWYRRKEGYGRMVWRLAMVLSWFWYSYIDDSFSRLGKVNCTEALFKIRVRCSSAIFCMFLSTLLEMLFSPSALRAKSWWSGPRCPGSCMHDGWFGSCWWVGRLSGLLLDLIRC